MASASVLIASFGNDDELLRSPDEKWVIQETPVSAFDSVIVRTGATAEAAM